MALIILNYIKLWIIYIFIMQMKVITIVNLLLLIALQVNCSKLYYAYVPQSTTFYQCFLNAGRTKITVNITQGNNTDTINETSIQNIKNAKSFGISVEGIITPCRFRTVEQNVQIIAQAFPERLVDRFWVEMPSSLGRCGWSNYPAASNCQYLQEFIMRMKQNFWTEIGIYTTRKMWIQVFKNQLQCPEVSNNLLWWSPEALPSKPDFSDYTKIGGWDLPYAKFFNLTAFCSTIIFESYFQE